jgi:hypothetical protein
MVTSGAGKIALEEHHSKIVKRAEMKVKKKKPENSLPPNRSDV